MRNLIPFFLILIFIVLPARAATIAIVDADYLMNESVAAKDIKQQMKSQRDQFQGEYKAAEGLLKKEEQGLIEKRKNLTEEEFKKQVMALQKKMSDEQTRFQKKKQGLDKGFSEALKTLQKEIGLTIQQVAKEKNIEMVLSKQSILYAAAGQIELTEEVLAKLNERVKTVKVKI
jgi:Skp family chaperone for outer membrane proteins